VATNKRNSSSKRTAGRSSSRQERPVLDDRSKRDIIGVALSALAIALMIAVLSRSTGVASGRSGHA